jgi:hypothetical protein
MHNKTGTGIVLAIIAAIVLGNLADQAGVFTMPDKVNSLLFAALAVWHISVLATGWRRRQVDVMHFGPPIRQDRNPIAFWFVFLAFSAMMLTLLTVMVRHLLL